MTKFSSLDVSFGAISYSTGMLMSTILVVLRYKKHAKLAFIVYEDIDFFFNPRFLSDRALQLPFISFKDDMFLVEVMTSWRSPKKNWKALDCQFYWLNVTSSYFFYNAYLSVELKKVLLIYS